MTLTVSSDIEYKYFEVTTKNKKFADYPLAFRGGWNGETICTCIDKKKWFQQLEAIAEWVNNELGEECLFEFFK